MGSRCPLYIHCTVSFALLLVQIKVIHCTYLSVLLLLFMNTTSSAIRGAPQIHKKRKK